MGTDLSGVRVLVLFTGTKLFGHERANIEVFRTLCATGLKARFVVDRRWSPAELQPTLAALGLEFATAAYGYQWGGFLRGRHWYLTLVNIWGVVATSAKVMIEILSWKPTHVYAANSLHLSYALPVLSFCRLPLIYRAGDELPMHSVLHRWISRWVARRATTVVCISEYIRERYRRVGVPEKHLKVIYNYPPARLSPGVPPPEVRIPERCIITFIGQISVHKGVIMLLDAIEKMSASRQDFVVWFLGVSSWNDGLLESLQRRVQEGGLQDLVTFWGYQPDVSSFLSKTDILVCPSLFAEPLSNVIGEASVAGVPSVVFPAGGLPELVEHKVTGFICRDSSRDALIEGLEYFMDDPASRKAAGINARQHFNSRFGFERFQRQWMEVFAETC